VTSNEVCLKHVYAFSTKASNKGKTQAHPSAHANLWDINNMIHDFGNRTEKKELVGTLKQTSHRYCHYLLGYRAHSTALRFRSCRGTRADRHLGRPSS
jgi:hypothetical protein